MPLVGFDLAGLATFVLCPLVLPLVCVAHWICWAHWCCRLVFGGPLVLFATVFPWPAGFATSCLLPHWFCRILVCWPTRWFCHRFWEHRTAARLNYSTRYPYPLPSTRHGRARGGELARREAAALAAATPAVFLVFGAMWVRCWCLRAYKCTMLGLSGTTVGLS